MRKIQSILFAILIFLSFTNNAQNIKDGKLDKYYSREGEGFARYITSSIKYPQAARGNGTVGVVAFSFRIDCQNSPVDFVFENKLGNGIEEEIERIIKTTQGNWLSCNERDQSERVKLKFAFGINNYNYNPPDADIVIVAFGNFSIVKDAKLEKQYNKALKKGKLDKAKEAIEELIRRYPNDDAYLEKKKKIESMMKN